MTLNDTINFNETIVFVLASAFILALMGLFFHFVKKYFTNIDDELSNFGDELSVLGKNKEKMSAQFIRFDENINRHSKVIDRLTDRLVEVLADSKAENIRLIKLEGRVDEHLNMLSGYISTISHMSRQIDALFVHIDKKGD